MATEEGLGRWLLERVDEDGSSLQTLTNALGTSDVLAPHTCSKTGLAGVGTLDNLLLIVPWLGRNNWTKRLFLDDHRVVRRIVDDGWLDEKTFARSNVWLTNGELVTLALCNGLATMIPAISCTTTYLGVLEEGLDLFVLHLVLNWAKLGTVSRSTNGHGLCAFDHSGKSLLVYVLVDVDTFGGNANLARILESAHHELRSNCLDVHIWENNRSVVAAKLKSYTLECLSTCSHDLFAGSNGSSEGNLGDAGMSSEHWAKGIITANGLNDTRREYLLSDLDKLERCVRSERTGLHDNGVAR